MFNLHLYTPGIHILAVLAHMVRQRKLNTSHPQLDPGLKALALFQLLGK